MAYFRKLSSRLAELQALLNRDDNWMVLISADPDAIAGAFAFQRLISKRVHSVTIARINEVTRPDNLAMLRYLRVPVVKWEPSLAPGFQRFAIVDSQPHHSPAFDDVNFSVIIDHHPKPPTPFPAPFQEIRPDIGATSTLMTEFLYNAELRPGRRLATALQYGIRTDTNTFGRNSTEVDIRAYHYLTRFADPALLTRIMRSEYLPEWLPYFSRAFVNLRPCASGSYTWLGVAESADVLVVVADFFLRVHGLRWVVVCGRCRDTLVAVFRGGLGRTDVGHIASLTFEGGGSGGGHRALARAECAVRDAVAAAPGETEESMNFDVFCFRRVREAASRHRKEKAEAPEGEPSAPPRKD